MNTDFLPSVFSGIFNIILPVEKREKVQGANFYKHLTLNDKICIPKLDEQIGLAYKQYFDFFNICSELLSWKNNLRQVACQPEVLGRNWDVLNGNFNFLKTLVNWLETIITDRKNPIDDSNFTDYEITRLQQKYEILSRAYDDLVLEIKKLLHVQLQFHLR